MNNTLLKAFFGLYFFKRFFLMCLYYNQYVPNTYVLIINIRTRSIVFLEKYFRKSVFSLYFGTTQSYSTIVLTRHGMQWFFKAHRRRRRFVLDINAPFVAGFGRFFVLFWTPMAHALLTSTERQRLGLSQPQTTN